MNKPPKDTSRNYLDKEKVYQQFVIYHKKMLEAKEKNEELPRVPESIGKAILLICTNLGKLWKFRGYTYNEDMIGYAIEQCIRYVNNFDPNKSKEPFSYFTQIAIYAFIRYIQKEKKQRYIQVECMKDNEFLSGLVTISDHDDYKKINLDCVEFIKNYIETNDKKEVSNEDSSSN